MRARAITFSSMDAVIDVVIPNRNKVKFLPRTLASLKNQTEPRWRAIVVDGESTDGSLELLRETARLDPRFTVKTALPAFLTGLSLYRSWNHGLLRVRTPFFAILTSDDLWQPDWLEKALNGLDSHPSAIAAVARALEIDENDNIRGHTATGKMFEDSFGWREARSRLLPSKACALRAILLGPIFSTIHSMVFRAAMLDEGVLFTEDTGILADIEYYLNTCLRGDILYLPECNALFRTYSQQASRETKGEGIHILWRKVVERNRRLVSLYTGVPLLNITEVSQAILDRHSFVMTKPDKSTFRQNKTLALYRLLKAFVKFPHLAIEYLLCRTDKEKFLHQKIVQTTRVLAQSNTASENSGHFDP